MRVLLLAEAVDPRSGWGRYASAIASEYRARKVAFSLISAKKDERVPEVIETWKPLSPMGFVRNALRARELAKDADIVHAFDCWPLAVYGYFAVLGTKKKLFVTGVGTYSVAPFRSVLKRALLTPALKRASKIFAIGNYTKKRMLECLPLTNIETVFWGASPLPELGEKEMEPYYERFNLPRRHPIILTVGMVKHRKGQYDTLRAVVKLRAKYPDILYVAVGFTDDTAYVEKMRTYAKDEGAEDALRIVDTADDDRSLAFFYQAADVFAMNSNNDGDHFEGFGLVFLEAEQFGKPVIGSRDCGIEEALEDGKNGYLARQSDVDDIAGKLDALLSGDMEAFGKHSKEFFAKFTWGKTAEAYLGSYAS